MPASEHSSWEKKKRRVDGHLVEHDHFVPLGCQATAMRLAVGETRVSQWYDRVRTRPVDRVLYVVGRGTVRVGTELEATRMVSTGAQRRVWKLTTLGGDEHIQSQPRAPASGTRPVAVQQRVHSRREKQAPRLSPQPFQSARPAGIARYHIV